MHGIPSLMLQPQLGACGSLSQPLLFCRCDSPCLESTRLCPPPRLLFSHQSSLWILPRPHTSPHSPPAPSMESCSLISMSQPQSPSAVCEWQCVEKSMVWCKVGTPGMDCDPSEGTRATFLLSCLQSGRIQREPVLRATRTMPSSVPSFKSHSPFIQPFTDHELCAGEGAQRSAVGSPKHRPFVIPVEPDKKHRKWGASLLVSWGKQ